MPCKAGDTGLARRRKWGPRGTHQVPLVCDPCVGSRGRTRTVTNDAQQITKKTRFKVAERFHRDYAQDGRPRRLAEVEELDSLCQDARNSGSRCEEKPK